MELARSRATVQLAWVILLSGSNAYQACSLSLELFCGEAEASLLITDLLNVTIDVSNSLQRHVHWKCVRQLGNLEKAAEDLVRFRNQGISNGMLQE